MKKLFLYSTLSLIAAIGINCGKTDPKLQAPIQTFQAVEYNSAVASVKPNSKVDIVFIVDNSTSMDPHQVNLAQNINGFVNGFTKNAMIDFHIGVMPIYDSIKCGKKIACPPVGQLLPLKDPSSDDPQKTLAQNFVDRSTPDLVNVLKKTILMGTKLGPEFEELLSPAYAAIQPAMVNGGNKGFFRTDAKLVFVWLSDADDNSPNVTSDQLADSMIAFKGGDRSKVAVYEVLAFQDMGISCAKDTAEQSPERMTDLYRRIGGERMSICDPNFGKHLSEIGDHLSKEVGAQTIYLGDIPDARNLQVQYGNQIIPESLENGWVYDYDAKILHISGNIVLNAEPGAKITYRYVPVDETNIQNGKTRPIVPQQ